MLIDFFSPLDQFLIISFFPTWSSFCFLGLIISNVLTYCIFFLFLFLFFCLFLNDLCFFISFFFIFIFDFFFIFKLLLCNISYICNFLVFWFLTIIFILFFFNVFGLIPFGFTITTHFIVSISMSLVFFIWINFIFFFRFFIEGLNIFVPSGSPTSILLLIIPIELISYISRLFSLAIRLFANMMSGHTLLIILFSFLFLNIHLNFFFLIPGLVLHSIYFIEIGVAFLQIYVFAVLSTLYLQDTLYSSH